MQRHMHTLGMMGQLGIYIRFILICTAGKETWILVHKHSIINDNARLIQSNTKLTASAHLH